MNKTIIVGVGVLAVIVAGVMYLADDAVNESSTTAPPESGAGASVRADARQHETSTSQSTRTISNPAPHDPRLATLKVSADNGLIEFVRGADGKVVKEIDKDPNSLGYRKPLREYTYSGDQVIGLTAYQYFSDHVQVVRTTVSYKPDGSVDQYQESTSY